MVSQLKTIKNLQIGLCQNQIEIREVLSVGLIESLADSKRELQTKKDILEQEILQKNHIAQTLANREVEANCHAEAILLLKAGIDTARRRREVRFESIDAPEQKLMDDSQKEEELIELAEERCARSEVTISDTDTSSLN
ncbi:hypothetical protein METBIDRAFT_188276 [Metschnikowia bicuspidata var. bicuspidata NRRL YB-4993]|uniref:Uncharacterized protein n=1 Tax=Metschnikowia bicuspidata var. bicuspidata NRRL YB-4993 TaxID=869754 RepID=A0A1A0HC60_9ASCO|nr:hypothetical protein METBIDRAFT_188276 [Metschnikowia bicuspidata var. bicuspidata NRRL YB-4993]OBA21575.1 hypothetical protein METBIDRAFT_188276 [Metschnikowia bicuspidata var. bicuspidata NRRL YB-4993]